MKKTFDSIKKKKLAYALVGAAAFGVLAGLAVAGGVMITLKLLKIAFSVLWYILIGAGSGIVAFAVAFLIMRPTDRKLAKALDKEYALGEKVQTAVEFDGRDGAVITVQRDDARETLANLPKRRTRYKSFFGYLTASKFWQYLAAVVVAACVFSTALVLPSPKPVDADDPFEVTEFQVTVIQGLIQDVKASSLESDEKEGAIASLTQLIDDLRAAEKDSQKLAAVSHAIDGITAATTSKNSYKDFYAALNSSGQADFARAILRGGDVYREYPLDDFSKVKEYYRNRGSTSQRIMANSFEKYRKSVETEEGLISNLALAAEITSEAILSVQIKDGDELAGLLDGYVNDLLGIVEKANAAGSDDSGEGSDDNNGSDDSSGGGSDGQREGEEETFDAAAETKKLFDELAAALAGELGDQAYKQAMNKYVCNTLRHYFDMDLEQTVRLSDDPLTDDGSVSGGGGGGNEEGGNGGFGTGDAAFPSDDEVYDPKTGTYVKYGDLLAQYYADMQKMLGDDGVQLTEQQEAEIQEYFQMLFSGIKTEEPGE